MLLGTLTALLAVLSLGAIVGCCVFSAPRYRGQASDHFDGERFRNHRPTEHGGFGDVLRWMWTREPGPWLDSTDALPGDPPPRRVGSGELRVTFVNHATVLVQMDGINILTDPIWSERCSPVSWAGPKRVRPPGIRFEDLPPIDVVLVSHNHYDHLDIRTLERLTHEHHPRIFSGLGNGALLEAKGLRVAEDLDWWQNVDIASDVRLTAVPAQHFSSRGLCDRDRTLWVGFVVTGPAGSVYFAGDTGWGPHFEQIRERLGPPRLALLPIGAFRPEWFMSRVHISPDEAVRAHQVLGAGTSVAIHFGTFRLGDDGQDEAPARLEAVITTANTQRPRFWVLRFGEGRSVPPLEP